MHNNKFNKQENAKISPEEKFMQISLLDVGNLDCPCRVIQLQFKAEK